MFSLSESVATSCSAVGSGFGRRRLAAQRRALVAPAVSDPPETGGKRGVRKARCAEAGSDIFDSLVASCESHVTRFDRANVYAAGEFGVHTTCMFHCP